MNVSADESPVNPSPVREPRRAPARVARLVWAAWFPWLAFLVGTILATEPRGGAAGVFSCLMALSWLGTGVAGLLAAAAFKRELEREKPEILQRRNIGTLAFTINVLRLIAAARDADVVSDPVLREHGARVRAWIFAPLLVFVLLLVVSLVRGR